MEKTLYQVDGYGFSSKKEYERALKEKETVSYLMANTDVTDSKALLKIYNRSIEKDSFRTVVGIEYMRELRKSLVGSGAVSAESLAPIPVHMTNAGDIVKKAGNHTAQTQDYASEIKRYKEAYEAARAGRIIKNLAIVVLIVVVFAMLFISYKSQYSVFTYFTDYKETIREEVADEYEEWQHTLEEKEKDLEKREDALQQQQ